MKLVGPEDELSEEHERQIARFQGLPYEPGARLRALAWVRFKAYHHALLIERQTQTSALRKPRKRSGKQEV
jgi:hypothetical protein